MRLAKYTPQDSQEIKDWIGDTLGEKLPVGDLMVVLKDGVVLCKWVFQLPFPLLLYEHQTCPYHPGPIGSGVIRVFR